MRLNKSIKTQIVENWVAQKWAATLKEGLENAEAELRSIFEGRAAHSAKVAATNANLAEYLRLFTYFELNYQINEQFNFVEGQNFKKHFACTQYACKDTYGCASLGLYKNQKEKAPDVVAVYKKYNAMALQFSNEKYTVESVLASVTTVKKLVDIAPDIEKYVPKQSGCTQLVNAGDLVRLKAIL